MTGQRMDSLSQWTSFPCRFKKQIRLHCLHLIAGGLTGGLVSSAIEAPRVGRDCGEEQRVGQDQPTGPLPPNSPVPRPLSVKVSAAQFRWLSEAAVSHGLVDPSPGGGGETSPASSRPGKRRGGFSRGSSRPLVDPVYLSGGVEIDMLTGDISAESMLDRRQLGPFQSVADFHRSVVTCHRSTLGASERRICPRC